jgi:hypothetical protein
MKTSLAGTWQVKSFWNQPHTRALPRRMLLNWGVFTGFQAQR